MREEDVQELKKIMFQTAKSWRPIKSYAISIMLTELLMV